MKTSPAYPTVFSTSSRTSCEWSGIDDVLIFESYRTGHVEIFRSRLGGADVHQFTNYDANVGFPMVVPRSLFDGGAGH